MGRRDKLWHELGGPGPLLEADTQAVIDRVNAVLGPEARTQRRPRKRSKSLLLLAAALLAAGMAGALASGWTPNVLNVFFRGNTTPGLAYLTGTSHPVSDADYRFTVESAAADQQNIYLVARVEPRTELARTALFSEAFLHMDTFDLQWSGPEREEGFSPVDSLSFRPLDAPEGSRRFALNATTGAPADRLLVRLSQMKNSPPVELDLTPAPAAAAALDASGTGTMSLYGDPAGELTIRRVILTPFSCRIEGTHLDRAFDTRPRIFFRMADGSLRTQSQMMEPQHDSVRMDGRRAYSSEYRFYQVQDLGAIRSIIAFDTEYPLNGDTPRTVRHDPALDPFTLPSFPSLSRDGSRVLPVRALTEHLGGTCRYDPASGTVRCTYRDTAIVLQPGSTTAVVNGSPVSLPQAPELQDGVLLADHQLFDTYWGLDSFVLRNRPVRGEDTQIVWGDWYIVP